MAYNDIVLTAEQDDVLMMNPDGGADYDDEGSGATSGYGDTTEDDLLNDEDIEDPLETDPDDALQGDDDLADDDDI